MANVRQRLRTGAQRLRRRFVSINSLPEFHDITSTPQSAVGRNRTFSMDNLESDSRRRIAWQEEDVTWDRSHVLTTEWLKEWQVVLSYQNVFPMSTRAVAMLGICTSYLFTSWFAWDGWLDYKTVSFFSHFSVVLPLRYRCVTGE